MNENEKFYTDPGEALSDFDTETEGDIFGKNVGWFKEWMGKRFKEELTPEEKNEVEEILSALDKYDKLS